MTRSRPTALVRALRPRQWIKNVLVAAAPVAAGSLDEADTFWRTLAAIVLFIAASGSTYLFNDAADVDVDRAHPTKRHRPIAAGLIPVHTARVTAAALATAALGGAFAIRWPFGLVILAYLAVNLSYSAGMKHWPGVELAAIASGFVLRAVGGGAATETPLSAWFVVVVCGVSLFVVVGKRIAELRRTKGDGGRRVLARYDARALHGAQAVSAGGAVVAYVLWVLTQDLANAWLAAASLVPFTASLARYARAIESGLGEDPEDILLGDRAIQVIGVAWVVVYGLAVYG